MSIALARKYRPKNFASVAVQSHVSNTLKGAIARGRVAHGYLLCGPRGTGKTTLARVLAMALNCERRFDPLPTSAESGAARATGASATSASASDETRSREAGEPCGECTSCTRIWSGSASLDVVEIDAASNRGVDDARDLRERAMYAPSGEGRYKVYIVDEAHMLTREAWNALLKVLEEPPPRVVFVFATTEPQKIAQAAAPVLSRLQRFDLKRIPTSEIRDRLATVLRAESIDAEPDALGMIARAADGSMRDALSLTDQVISIGAGAVTADRVREALGLVPEDEYVAMLDLISERRAGDVFPTVARLAEFGVDFGSFLAGLAETLRAALAVELGGGSASGVSERMRAALEERRGRLAAGDLLRMLGAVSELEPRFRKSGQQQLLLETLLVRFALLDRSVALEEVLRGLASGGAGSAGGGGDSPPAGRAPAATARAPIDPGAGRADRSLRPPWPQQTAATAPAAPGRDHAPRAQAPAPDRGARAWQASTAAAPALAAAPAAVELDDRVAGTIGTIGTIGTPEVAPLELNRVIEKWDDVVARIRDAGKAALAGALTHMLPSAVNARGDVTLSLDEPNEFFERAFDAAKPDIVAALREHFPAAQRVALKRPDAAPAAPTASLRRVTAESLKQERMANLRKRDPVLGAAIDELDLELMD